MFCFLQRNHKNGPNSLKNPDELVVFRAYILLIQAILNLSYRLMLLAPLKIEHTVQLISTVGAFT